MDLRVQNLQQRLLVQRSPSYLWTCSGQWAVGSGLVYFFSLLPLCQLISFIHNSKAKKSIIIRYCGPWSKFQRPDDQSPTPRL